MERLQKCLRISDVSCLLGLLYDTDSRSGPLHKENPYLLVAGLPRNIKSQHCVLDLVVFELPADLFDRVRASACEVDGARADITEQNPTTARRIDIEESCLSLSQLGFVVERETHR